ncbi:MAG: nucleotidyltransferase family protein [Candidatus Binataceae bacterium]
MEYHAQTAVLLAAGRGTRLGALTADTPKPLLEVAGVPLIEHIVRALAEAGVRRFIIVTGYLGAQVEAWCAGFATENSGIEIAPFAQGELNGTAGAILAARPKLADQRSFIFGWGDVLMDRANYSRFVARAAENDFDLLLAANRMKDPWRGAAVYLSADLHVERLVEKPAQGESETEWNNAGLFAAKPMIFDYVTRLSRSPRGEFELPEAIAAMINDGREVRAIDMRGFWSDVGTPADLEIARKRFRPKRKPKLK